MLYTGVSPLHFYTESVKNKNLKCLKDEAGSTSGAQWMVAKPWLDDILQLGERSRWFHGARADILEWTEAVNAEVEARKPTTDLLLRTLCQLQTQVSSSFPAE